MARKNKGFMWFAGIFVLPLGVGSFYGAVHGMIGWVAGFNEARQAQTWPTAEARILDLSHEDSRSARGRSLVKLEGRFAYTYEGREYVSNELCIKAARMDRAETKAALFERLNDARTAARTVPCYVDPQNPERAVLSRDYEPAEWWTMLWGFYCLLLFGVFWVALSLVIVLGWRKRDQLGATYPDQPWMWRPQWQRNDIKPEPYAAVVLWPLGLAGAVGSLPLALVVLPETLRHGATFQTNVFTFLGLAVPAVFHIAAIVSTLRRRIIRSVVLRLEGVPVILGRPLRGELVLRLRSTAQQSVHAKLQHVQIMSKNKNTRKHTTPMGEIDATMVSGRDLGDATTYRIEIPTQAEWPEHNDDGPSDKTLWELIVWVGSPRAKLKFGLPLFRERPAASGELVAHTPAMGV